MIETMCGKKDKAVANLKEGKEISEGSIGLIKGIESTCQRSSNQLKTIFYQQRRGLLNRSSFLANLRGTHPGYHCQR